MDNQIHIENLNKYYTHKKKIIKALDDISLSLPSHRIIGLIGPNGAGKTTLIKAISGQIFPTNGGIRFNEASNHTFSYMVCAVNDNEDQFTLHKISTILEIACFHYPTWDQEYANDLIQAFKIDASKKYAKISKGQRGLVNIIVALASKAPITIFDETQISLDPLMRQKFFELILDEYNSTERTFIISTHYINEISNLFEDIIILNQGKVLLHDVKDSIDQKSFTLIGDTTIGKELLNHKNILKENTFGNRSEFHYFGDLPANIRTSLEIHDFTISNTSLEHFFLNILHKEGQHE